MVNLTQGSPVIDSALIAREIIKREIRFKPVIEKSGLCPIGQKKKKLESNFRSLSRSIISQQLSTKAAETIINRVETIASGLTPENIAKTDLSLLRQAGLSAAKARALKELADAKDEINFSRFALGKSDEEIYQILLPFYGIGPWTVEMFLIFQLGRMDIWPVKDLGVRRGWEKIHQLNEEISPKILEAQGERFSPFRSHLAWYCWRAL
jgi:DNA-3-methyladenine glycosylase II